MKQYPHQDVVQGQTQMLTPEEIAQVAVTTGIRKSRMGRQKTIALSILGGAFIGLGAIFYTAALVGVDPITGLAKVAAGISFSLGLILVLIGGAELFTGNVLMLMALWQGRLESGMILRNWCVVFLGNALGAVGLAYLMWGTGFLEGAHGAVARDIATYKMALSGTEAFLRGFFCNALVCLAIWLSYSANTVQGKVMCIVPPIAAFVAIGFEHSIANLYLIPVGMMAGAAADMHALFANISAVTAGNIAGAGAVALLYTQAFHKKPEDIIKSFDPKAAPIDTSR